MHADFLNRLHDEFRDDILVVVCDGAAWHKSSKLEVPENMTILHIPPYTPEMNPIEQIWRELRTQGFRNEVFATLEKVVNRLCETIRHLSKIQSSVLLVGNGFGAFLIGNSITTSDCISARARSSKPKARRMAWSRRKSAAGGRIGVN